MNEISNDNKILLLFAGTFAFWASHKPTQKNQKSLQANAQGQCKLYTTDLRPKRSSAGNRTYKKLAVQCSADTFLVNKSLVLRINICGKNRQLLVAAKRQTV